MDGLRFQRCACPFLAAVLLCGGCATGVVVQSDDYWVAPAPAAALAGQETSTQEAAPPGNGADNSKSKPSKPPAPRTVWQALHAYLQRVCSGQCLCENPPKDMAGAGKTGNENEKRGEEKSENQEKKGEKSPHAAGEAEGAKDPEKNGESKKDNDEEKKDEKEKEEKPKEPEPAWYSAHAQSTVVIQKHGGFHAPYQGANSLLENEPAATSMTGTLFLDVRLWECGSNTTELVFNPEIAGGRGLSDTSGIAGFPNGEVTRVGAIEPTPYIARLFVRQTWGLGGEREKVEDGPNQIAGQRDVDRIELTVGKFSATDYADDNKYSHDPRTRFLPWSFIYNGAWDYPANVRGYTYGVEIEMIRKDWTLSYGIVAEPEFANSAAIDPRFTKAFGQFLEWERRYKLYDHPGAIRFLAFLNRAHMGDYAEALAAMPVNPDVTLTRDYRYKYGFGISWDQELTKDLGVWARLGWADGHTEAWAFTAIDRLFDIGLLLKGRCWCRPNDLVGLALGINGLERTHRNYLAAGGLDFIIGDGALNYAPEQILEAFYNLEVVKGIYVTTDFQEVIHPAYNADRGPVSIVSLRVHIEF
jgi:high affinity Mn2+ porin